MDINALLRQKGFTKYRLSKLSGLSFTTISEITTGKTLIKNCTGETLLNIAKALDVTIEDLLTDSAGLPSTEYRQSFEAYKSNVCHMVKEMGDIDFIIDTIKSGKIQALYQKGWHPESLYLLAMVDYLSRENGLPICNEYCDIRKARLSEPIFPSSVIAMSALSHSDKPKLESYA